jgi:opacity protein-like surface antigen
LNRPFFCLLLLLYLTSAVSNAQISRDNNYFYFQTALAASAYFGDLHDVNADKPLFGFGIKGGAGYYLSQSVAVGIDYRVSDHPRITRPVLGNYTKNHTVNLYARYDVPFQEFWTPYLIGGVGITYYGTYDRDPVFNPVFGPMIGAGLTVRLTDQLSVFIEGKTDFILDDEAMDQMKGDAGYDMLGFFGIGIRVALRRAFRPVGAVSISGPTVITGMESVVFEAVVGGEPSEPIRYQWDLGDGTRAIGSSISHVYLVPDSYQVMVRVSNGRSYRVARSTIVVRSPD